MPASGEGGMSPGAPTQPASVQAVDPAPTTAAPAYLTVDQVGEMLQLSGKTIYRLVTKDPTMPALRLGGTVRFPRERLERWLRDREQGRPRPRLRSAP